ncbi:MAG: PQQ-binding-like beta-propeller repeat protein [Pseudomonadota bacterium]
MALALSLTACGGGGGSTSAPGGGYLTLTPASNVNTFEGESVSFVINASSSKTFAVPAQIAIISPGGITSQVYITHTAPLAYEAMLFTAPELHEGVQTINLTVRICEDDPRICSKPFPGSPWNVAQTVTVKSKAEGAKRLALTYPALDFAVHQGESVEFQIDGTHSKFPARASISLVDPAGLIMPNVEIVDNYWNQPATFTVVMKTSTNLLPGVYSTNLELRLCAYQPPAACQPFSGSPWLVPLKVTVKSNINLSTLSTLAQLGPWNTYQGNAAHTGSVAAAFNPANFSRRWSLPTGVEIGMRTIAIDNGRVFQVHGPSWGHTELRAIREDTGQVEWQVALGKLYNVNPPAAANGRVYMTGSDLEHGYLWIFDQATGNLIASQQNSDSYYNPGPAVLGNDVYMWTDSTISKFNGTSLALNWSLGAPSGNKAVPSVDANYVYTYTNNTFAALNGSDGAVAYTIVHPLGWNTTTVAPVLSSKQMAYIVDGKQLVAFDLATRTLAWTAGVDITTQPVYANGVLYMLSGTGIGFDATRVLEARSADTGALLWSTSKLVGTIKETHFDSLLVTDNLIFVGSGYSTLAIDLTSRKVVWTNTLGGDMALSNRGVLYILNFRGELGAINLQ